MLRSKIQVINLDFYVTILVETLSKDLEVQLEEYLPDSQTIYSSKSMALCPGQKSPGEIFEQGFPS